MFHGEQIPNKRHRGPGQVIRLRDWPQAQRLLRIAGISLAAVAERSGVPRSTVHHVLSPKHCAGVAHGRTYRVRRTIERMLAEMGTPFDAATIWRDIDSRFEPETNPNNEPPPVAA